MNDSSIIKWVVPNGKSKKDEAVVNALKRKYEKVQAAKKAKKTKKPPPVHAAWSDEYKAQYVSLLPSLPPPPICALQMCQALHRA